MPWLQLRAKEDVRHCVFFLSASGNAFRRRGRLHAAYRDIFARPLSSPPALCQIGPMRFMSIIHRALLLSALLGIILGPVTIGVASSAMASSVSTHMTAMDMAEDMCCCPDETSGCGGVACPLAVLCATAFVGHAVDEQTALLNPVWTAHQFLRTPYPLLTSTQVDPPARPPRA